MKADSRGTVAAVAEMKILCALLLVEYLLAFIGGVLAQWAPVAATLF
jgi:hypothetical protein